MSGTSVPKAPAGSIFLTVELSREGAGREIAHVPCPAVAEPCMMFKVTLQS